jgi:hypothetical protein
MANSAEAIFEQLARRPYETWMKRIEGRLRFDVTDGPATEHWTLTVGEGHLQMSRDAGDADAVVTIDRTVLNALAAGETRPIVAFLRNDMAVKGGFRYVLLFDRLLPGGPDYQPETTAPAGETHA